MARKPVDQPTSTPVKMTVLIDVETHARLAALAALSRCDRSALAVRFIREGLKGTIAVIDKRKSKLIDATGSVDRVDPASHERSADAA